MGQLLGRSNEVGLDDAKIISDSTRAIPSLKRKTVCDDEVGARKKKISKVRVVVFKEIH